MQMTASNPERSLVNRRILITRPVQQQQSLQNAIQQCGGSVASLPLLTIEGIVDSEVLQRARTLVQDLDQFHIVIFISSNAVSFGGDLIDDFWPQFPVGISVIAIGESTAQAASTRFACDVIRPTQGSDSEAVLALPALQGVRDKRIAIVRGRGGRELLASSLRERGARVDYIEVYERNASNVDPAALSVLVEEQGIDAITVHSGESLNRLIAVSADNIDKVTLIPLIVPSLRIADQAREAGFQQVINAVGADDGAMIKALSELFEGTAS